MNSLIDQLKRGEFLTQSSLDSVLDPDVVRRSFMQDKITQLINEAQGVTAPQGQNRHDGRIDLFLLLNG